MKTKGKIKNMICGYDWTAIQDVDRTYYFMNGWLFESGFGQTNDYRTSYVREKLLKSDLLFALKEEFGEKLLPISLDLTSMDGFKDYGSIEGDFMAIPNVEIMMKFGYKIPLIDKTYWLSTPNQTSYRNDSTFVQCVCFDGGTFCDNCDSDGTAVRPFFTLRP